MKGLIFNEFLDFVERRSGYETTDRMIALSKLPSGGAYTAAGNYPYTEMSALMTAYCEISEQKLPELLQVFGEYLFQRFTEIYPALFENCDDPFDFFEVLEERFHAQILKFYPDAELPDIKTKLISEDALLINYRSCKPLGHLCIGLIRGCGVYFNVDFDIAGQAVKDGFDITISRPARAVYAETG